MDASGKIKVQVMLELNDNYSVNVELANRSKMVDVKIDITTVSSKGRDC